MPKRAHCPTGQSRRQLHWPLLAIPLQIPNPNHRRGVNLGYGLRRSKSYSVSNGRSTETPDHTNIKQRIKPQFNLSEAMTQAVNEQTRRDVTVPLKPLLPFDGVITQAK
ncbi:MAG: hypothetical protein ACJAUP_003892 [Cellvibrionaceae bacterium]|jgi:hypothetical protein